MNELTRLALKKLLEPYIPEAELLEEIIDEIGLILVIPKGRKRCNDPRKCPWTEEEVDKLEKGI